MIKEVNPGFSGSNPVLLTPVGSILYFACNDGTSGQELWKTNGSAAGTVMVKDIASGALSSSPQHLTAIGSTLYFLADDGTNGKELWKTDGSVTGTVMVKDINPGALHGTTKILSSVDNWVFFTGTDDNGSELWKSNGTPEGTVRVQDLFSGSSNSNPSAFVDFNDIAYLIATTPDYNTEIFVAPMLTLLPVQHLEFDGKLQRTDGILQWSTKGELNTQSFELQRSTDGLRFIPLATLPAAGTTEDRKIYQYTDKNITALNCRVVYYRLKIQDVDGKVAYSSVVPLFVGNQKGIVLLYPNPFKDEAVLKVSASKEEKSVCTISNLNGHIVYQKAERLQKGMNTLKLALQALPAGVYGISIKGRQINQTLQLIKL